MAVAIVLGLATLAAPVRAQGADEIQEADRDFERGDYAKAAKVYYREIRRAPRQVSPEAYAQRARIFLIQGQEEAGGEKNRCVVSCRRRSKYKAK